MCPTVFLSRRMEMIDFFFFKLDYDFFLHVISDSLLNNNSTFRQSCTENAVKSYDHTPQISSQVNYRALTLSRAVLLGSGSPVERQGKGWCTF